MTDDTTVPERQDGAAHMLPAVTGYFGLGAPLSTVRAGGTNENYVVRTPEGTYLCKVLRNVGADDLLQGEPFLRRLESHGFPYSHAYLRTADGEMVYRGPDADAVMLPYLDGDRPEISEPVVTAIGTALARLHLVPADGLPDREHWLDGRYLATAVAEAVAAVGAERMPRTLAVYERVRSLDPTVYPQVIIHGDLDTSNCVFRDGELVAFIDWQDVGAGAAVIDFASTVIGFCFRVHYDAQRFEGEFQPDLYRALYRAYTAVRPFTAAESAVLETALHYVGITQPVWSITAWDQYHPDEEMREERLTYWAYGLDTLRLPEL